MQGIEELRLNGLSEKLDFFFFFGLEHLATIKTTTSPHKLVFLPVDLPPSNYTCIMLSGSVLVRI